MKVVRFLQDHSPYMKGEVASFSNEDADVRIEAGVCELVKEYDRQPDQRVVDNVDESGRLTKIEARRVPDDLQREADLPPTETGGRPKDETHMSESEKKRRLIQEEAQAEAKAMDAPPQSKMVSRPAAKK
jgi:polyhydroxyalkanoate synthesis regulator phasin